MLDELREHCKGGAEGYAPATLMKPLLPTQAQMLEILQKSPWPGFGKLDSTTSDELVVLKSRYDCLG